MANIYDNPYYDAIVNPKTPRLALEPLYPNFGAPILADRPFAPEYGAEFVENELPYLKELTPTTDMATGIVPLLKNDIPTILNKGFINAPQDYYGGVPELNLDRFQGIASLGRNDDDVEQVEFLGSRPKRFQEGIGKLFELAQRFSPIAAIARGINTLRDRFDTRQAIREDIARDTQGGPITTFRNQIQQQQDRIDDRGRGQIPSRTTSAPKKSSSNSYSEAKRSFFRD